MGRWVFWVVALLPLTATAETVTYEFAGNIDTIYFNDNGAFPEGYVGQPFTGWFSYSSDSHISGIGAIAFSIGSFQSGNIDERLYAFEDPTYLYFSYYGKQGDYDFGRTGLTFVDDTGQAFENDNQLLTALDLSLFNNVEFEISGYKTLGETFIGDFNLGGQVTTLNLVTPEPASIILMLAGGLFLRRTR